MLFSKHTLQFCFSSVPASGILHVYLPELDWKVACWLLVQVCFFCRLGEQFLDGHMAPPCPRRWKTTTHKPRTVGIFVCLWNISQPAACTWIEKGDNVTNSDRITRTWCCVELSSPVCPERRVWKHTHSRLLCSLVNSNWTLGPNQVLRWEPRILMTWDSWFTE